MSTVTKETFWTHIVEDPTLYGTITTDDNLFNYRSDAVWQVMNETFIANGTNFEVTKWEELLGLNVTETTLNGRKAAILNHITENLPITIGILEQLIKELTDGDYRLIYVEDGNKINVVCNEEYVSKVEEFSSRLIPIVPKVDYIGPLPAGYIAAEFLESDGKSAVIDPLITPDNETGIWVKVHTLTQSSGYYLGTQNSSGQPAIWLLYNNLGDIHYRSSSFKVTDDRYAPYWFEFNWKNNKKVISEITSTEITDISQYSWLYHLTFFRATFKSNNTYDNGANARFYFIKISQGVAEVRNMVPSIDSAGVPCMFDKVTYKPFYNSGTGSFIVGMTMEQAHKLDKLPESGGAMTISLPTGYNTDAEVTNALETARSNGWTLTIQTHTPEESTSTASTFGMRRIWVRKTQDENGSYVDANGNRFQVEWCVEIYSPENKTPEDFGYEQFRSVESAVEYWELTPYVDPTLEEQFNITNEEQ